MSFEASTTGAVALKKSPSSQSVAHALDENGLAWPSIGAHIRLHEDEEKKAERTRKIADAVKIILECIGEDPSREGIVKTPMRYAKALMYLTRGYETQLSNVVNDAIFQEEHDEMVIVRDITVHSLCEHHLLPFMGTVRLALADGQMNIGYVPNQNVIGLSKLARIADMFSQRLQVQERLTKQVAAALMQVIEPAGVAVTMKAAHMCMCMRGANKPGSTTVTSCMLGIFRDSAKSREEFLTLCRD
ncbi:hypothetical protein HDU91_005836 [Kappamyces sp. JEL0680]|nr:hypothetical protein HDU91_005836 [Kappamyces sp. JEL0680]